MIEDSHDQYRALIESLGIDDDLPSSVMSDFDAATSSSGVSLPPEQGPSWGPRPPVSTTAMGTGKPHVTEDDTDPAIASDPSVPKPPREERPPIDLPTRYLYLTLIGKGSMGEVYGVFDRRLRRILALKVIRSDLRRPERAASRFVEEAQINAQLAHPGIVPIHDLGALPDGRLYFTARLAKGRSLTEIIKELHEERRKHNRFVVTPTGWTLRRLVEAYRRLCDAVAYAHSRRVVHRDLKPDNVRVGEFGDVMLLDWGLARPLSDSPGNGDDAIPVESYRRRGGAMATREGTVAGTPAFMSPEQARGEHGLLSPASDVYALGGVLYVILFGHHPYVGLSAQEALARVRSTPPPFPTSTPWAPDLLVTICHKAMSTDPLHRYADAGILAEEIGAWLEGVRAQEIAREAVTDARARMDELNKEHAARIRRLLRAQRALARLRNTDSLDVKEQAWNEDEDATQALVEMEDPYQAVAQQLRIALEQAPDLPEARAALADFYHHRHLASVSIGDKIQARFFERLVREYDIGRHAAFLARQGAFTLHTDPPGAQVEIYRNVVHGRRLVKDPVKLLGPTPLVNVPLEAGSYLFVIRAPGYRLVNLPVEITSGETWEDKPPGASESIPLPLPRETPVLRTLHYIPRGWSVFGGDGEAAGALPRQALWTEGFFVERFPTIHQDYLSFLNALIREGKDEEARLRVPRMIRRDEPTSDVLYMLDPKGRYMLPPNLAYGAYPLQAPVTGITWHDVAAFCLWRSRETGLQWRLVGEAEREKAARGVDARPFPWGEFSDPAFHCFQDAVLEHPTPPQVTAFPIDSSPYGVRGLAGGVADWCAESFSQQSLPGRGAFVNQPAPPTIEDAYPPVRIIRKAVRGGSFDASSRMARSASRRGQSSTERREGVGFRLALSALEILGR